MRPPLRRSAPILVAAGLVLVACASTARPSKPEVPPALRATIDALYAAFCFDAGAEPDWATQRAIALEGATFVAPVGPDAPPEGVDLDRFLADFRDYAVHGTHAATGFHERVIGVRADRFGTIAHAFVAFEAFVPGQEPSAEGLDSLQFVHDGEAWRLVSFTTQWADGERALPERFRD